LTQIKISVGSTPPGEGRIGCQCDDLAAHDFKRCEKHSAQMEAIAELYHAAETPVQWTLLGRVCQYADGYGEVGFVPDWSGIRDSSAYAIEQMYAELQRG
jgi:hypothetical protein